MYEYWSSMWHGDRAIARSKGGLAVAALAIAAVAIASGVYFNARASDGRDPDVGSGKVIDSENVELAASQTEAIDVTTVSERSFPLQRDAVGSIDFNEDLLTQVFTPYQGRIVRLFAKLGDHVT